MVAIDGTRANWLDTLESMITGGIAGAVVVAPSLCDIASVMVNRLERLRRWGEEECIPVVVDSHWSASLAALSSEQLLAPDSVLVESVAVCESGGRPTPDVLVDQFMSINAILADDLELLTMVSDPDYYCIAARTPAASVQLLGVRSQAAVGKLSIRCYAPDADLTIEIPGHGMACPVQVQRVGSEGDHLYPTRYESPPRSSWRRVHHAVTSGRATDDLARLVRAMRLSGATLVSGLACY